MNWTMVNQPVMLKEILPKVFCILTWIKNKSLHLNYSLQQKSLTEGKRARSALDKSPCWSKAVGMNLLLEETSSSKTQNYRCWSPERITSDQWGNISASHQTRIASIMLIGSDITASSGGPGETFDSLRPLVLYQATSFFYRSWFQTQCSQLFW